MANKLTVFQQLDKAITGNWNTQDTMARHINNYDMSGNGVIYQTNDKDNYEKVKLELQQNKYLENRWVKANVDLNVSAYSGLNNVKLMYRDADLMDSFPEIGAALDIVSEESCLPSDTGNIVNVYSKSDRVKSILEDLFTNRLNLQLTAQMVIRGMCKYGNDYMMLDIDHKLGVKGWKRLPVFNVERIENGITNPYSTGYSTVAANNTDTNSDMSTKFVWLDDSQSQVPFRDWQIAHFRLLTNSMYLPYGVSYLNSARRHWRMLSLMEDMMLIYRLERSIERRVYKIFVGAIDDADVPAYVEEIANNFKRTPIIDPMTGQVDLRKNILPVHKDTPIPLLDGRTITIENLAKEYENGKENFVYSVQDDTHKIVPGKVVWCGKNYTADKLYRITLDDDTYLDLAGEHELIMRDGSKKRADEVSVGESVMPFYRKVDKNSKKLFDRYEKVYNPMSGKYEFTHRLIANEVKKTNEDFNTVHHKDFNKYNNEPCNLTWMDYHEHHKMHGDLIKREWNDPVKRAKRIKRLSESCKGRLITDETKEKISKTLKEKYSTGELDYVKKTNSQRIIEFNSSPIARLLRREQGLKKGYRKEFQDYNNSSKHALDNIIRRKSSKESWIGEGRKIRLEKMSIHFDDFIWKQMLDFILSHKNVTRKHLLDFINNSLIDYLIDINNNKRLFKNRFISRTILQNRIKEKGFKTITEYITASTKNHKIKSIDIIGGDDVYCMTVQGPNGEEDRHNFAIRSINSDKTWCENGCFVSNCVDQDIFIPVRDQNAPTPIDTLSAAQNLTAMDDIKFVQNKVLTALRIPKTFLNFEETAGDGKNLALMDIRFTRTVNRVQQAFLMELTKVASIHLFLLGFSDELTNFSLTMNNPSTQAESLEIDNIEKKITAVRDAVSDPGGGIPVMSQAKALKTIMKWSDKEIKENLEEIRLEKGISAELEKTTQIIKRTGLFDTVDRIYGEPGAEYMDDQPQQGGPDGGMGGGSMGGGGDFGGGLDSLGAPGSDDMGDIGGEEGSMPTGDMGGDAGAPPGGETPGSSGPDSGGTPMESVNKKKPLITENTLKAMKKNSDKRLDTLFENYIKCIDRKEKKAEEISYERANIYDKSLLINEEFDKMISSLDDLVNDNE